jgi:hypothetical protein
LVNLDNLIKPINNTSNNNAYNPFESPALKTKNLFQQNQPQVRENKKWINEHQLTRALAFLCLLESVHKSTETTAAVPRFAESGSMGARQQQRGGSGELTAFSRANKNKILADNGGKTSYRSTLSLFFLDDKLKQSRQSKPNQFDFFTEIDFANGNIDTLNNNHVINVDIAEEAVDESNDKVFDTGYVDTSFATAANLSKSLNDIYTQNIPQNGLRPNSLAIFKSDELFLSVSMRPQLSWCCVVIDSLWP